MDARASVHEALEPVLRDDWHVVAELETLARLGRHETRLFGTPIRIEGKDGGIAVSAGDGRALPCRTKYRHVWTSLGAPSRDIVTIPECEEPGRHVLSGGSIACAVSGLRMVENFLDLGHFPFVHTDYLGVEPRTEVKAYKVSVKGTDGIAADDCLFFQPVASPAAEGGFEVAYAYRVLRPYTVVLYKANGVHPDKFDFIGLFVQPVDEEHAIAHSVLAYLPHEIDAPTVRWYMQLIFAQDKPIIENQVPKRLPLDTAVELPVKSDASSVAYRRWLRSQGVRYGALPAA